VDRFAVWEKNHPEEAVLSLGDLHPSPDSAVRLDNFFDRRPDRSFDPFISDRGPVETYPQRFKITGGLHFANLAETTGGCCCGLTI
jgi:hypothetical protein